MRPLSVRALLAPLATALVLAATGARAAAQDRPPSTPQTSAAASADVATLDGILAAVYDVISGPAGEERDWDRMRALFHPGARFIPTGRSPDGKRARATVLDVEQYITVNGPWFKERGFFEEELGRQTLRYGQIAHVFSTYAARHSQGGEVVMRGVNSLQLVHDGTRWWVLTILWNPEVPGEALP